LSRFTRWGLETPNGITALEVGMSEAPKKIWMEPESAKAWAMEDNIFTEPYIRADIVDELAKKLEIALHVFRTYQAYHEYRDAFDKADRNKGYADQMESALKLLEEE
jgi:hypothetical protein